MSGNELRINNLQSHEDFNLFNKASLRVTLEIDVWNLDTFDNNSKLKNDSTKYLKKNCNNDLMNISPLTIFNGFNKIGKLSL